MIDTRTRVAIACQGGGSHTAFSAGALSTLLAESDRYNFVAFSGTSGGAIDALLAWCSVVRDGGKTAGQDLWSFWDDMSATSPSDAVLNAWTVHGYRALSSFVAPEVSPYRFPATEASGMARRKLRKTIEDHIDFDAIPRIVGEHSGELPMLFVGAVDVLSGRFRVFRNMRNTEPPDRYGKIELQLEVTADAIMA
ncbi:MAG: patatin-like phospholipase family protein, partial [Acidimicrobiales bacterium]